jgi:hypothetical protein
MQENVFRERVTLPVRYPTDGVDTSVSPRKHANVAEQDSNELISVLGSQVLGSQGGNSLAWRCRGLLPDSLCTPAVDGDGHELLARLALAVVQYIVSRVVITLYMESPSPFGGHLNHCPGVAWNRLDP